MKETREKGAVVVEAIMSMTVFMFTIMIILSIVDIAYTQSKIAIALNSAAKEISQYCFLYYKFQLDEANASLNNGTQEAEQNVQDTVDGLGQMMDSFGGAGSDFEEGNFDSALQQLENGANSANQTVTDLANKIAEDPKAFAIGMGKLAGREATEWAKLYLGQVLAKAFMAKNLKSSSSDDPDAFLKRLHVVDGMKGLDFQYTSLMAYGSSNEINLVCTYQVKVVQLLKVDYTFTFRQTAKTLAWGDGASLVTPRSIWTSMAPVARGKYIVEKEQEGYTYTDTNHGFDAFVNSGGKNEFVTITSLDPTNKTYEDVQGIKNRLSQNFSNMYSGVNGLGDPITVTKNGEETTVASDPSTRTYRILLVLPEETDAEYKAKVNQAISELKSKYPDVELNVDVKEGYGKIPKKEESKPEGEGSENQEVRRIERSPKNACMDGVLELIA